MTNTAIHKVAHSCANLNLVAESLCWTLFKHVCDGVSEYLLAENPQVIVT